MIYSLQETNTLVLWSFMNETLESPWGKKSPYFRLFVNPAEAFPKCIFKAEGRLLLALIVKEVPIWALKKAANDREKV